MSGFARAGELAQESWRRYIELLLEECLGTHQPERTVPWKKNLEKPAVLCDVVYYRAGSSGAHGCEGKGRVAGEAVCPASGKTQGLGRHRKPETSLSGMVT